MKNFQRFLSVTVIIGFFLPWIEFTGDMDQMKGALNEMWDVMGEFAGKSRPKVAGGPRPTNP
ncbi:hypothetical protein N8552_01015 [bacterium]|nr:hypothetical protein [bacterium]